MELQEFKMSEDLGDQKNTRNIEELSDEVLSIILSKLSFIDRSRCERISTRWQIVARDLSWSKVKFLDFNKINLGRNTQGRKIDIENLEFILKRCGKYLENISFVPLEPNLSSTQTNSGVVDTLSKVEKNIFDNICPYEMIASHCSSRLKNLNIRYKFKESGLSLLAETCTNLTNLSILASPKEEQRHWEKNLENLIEANKNLKHLEIHMENELMTGNFLLKLPFESIESLVFRQDSRIILCNICNVQFWENLTTCIIKCKNLKKFVFEGMFVNVDKLLIPLKNTKNLNCLKLINNSNKGLMNTEVRLFNEIFTNNFNLKSLHLRNVGFYISESIQCLNPNTLEELFLFGMENNFSEKYLEKLINLCSLEIIAIPSFNLWKIDDATGNVKPLFPNLKILKIRSSNISLNVVSNSNKCISLFTKLESLNLSGHYSILFKPVDGPLINLSCLSLTYNNISDIQLQIISEKLPNLKSFFMYYCNNITGECLGYFKNLVFLLCFSCPLMTYENLIKLLENNLNEILISYIVKESNIDSLFLDL